MTRLPPFARLFSRIYQSHRFLYTLIVLFLSLGMGFLSLVMFTFLALIGSYALSEHLFRRYGRYVDSFDLPGSSSFRGPRSVSRLSDLESSEISKRRSSSGDREPFLCNFPAKGLASEVPS